MIPRTPLKETLPRFFCAPRSSVKIGGGVRANPWIYASDAAKLLIVEQNAPTGCIIFSTGCGFKSTGCLFFSTCPFFLVLWWFFIYLSLLKKKKRRDKALERKNGIHGLAHLPIFSSTGYGRIHGLIRGNPWMNTTININKLNDYFGPSTHPRVVLPLGTFSLAIERML